MAEAEEQFSAAGLAVHETSLGRGDTKALGVELRGSKMESRATQDRYWKVRLATKQLLKRRRAVHCTDAGIIVGGCF